jgi:cytochrome c oxidase cbb3-type subunit III
MHTVFLAWNRQLYRRRLSCLNAAFAMRIVVLISLALVLAACEREQRRFSEPAPPARPSVQPPNPSARPAPVIARGPRYDENAYAIAQGKQLFGWFNCAGCHGHGGGNIGPALMDDRWIYGHEPADIYTTIMAGRPNGMPAFGNRITEQQAWQLAAYVRSMSGLVSKDAAPGRNDGISTGEPELRREPQKPRPAPVQNSAQQ